MIKHNNYIFISNPGYSGVKEDCSDGYLREGLDGNRRIKLPHANYNLLGIVDECINAAYAEEFSKEIVDYCSETGKGYWNYSEKGANGWVYQLQTAIESMKTPIEKLDLKPTDYILRDETH